MMIEQVQRWACRGMIWGRKEKTGEGSRLHLDCFQSFHLEHLQTILSAPPGLPAGTDTHYRQTERTNFLSPLSQESPCNQNSFERFVFSISLCLSLSLCRYTSDAPLVREIRAELSQLHTVIVMTLSLCLSVCFYLFVSQYLSTKFFPQTT